MSMDAQTKKGQTLQAQNPSEKKNLLKALVEAIKKNIEEAKVEREQLMLGKGSEKKPN